MKGKLLIFSAPSGSGKTTTAMMIEKLLDEKGHETHTLSMDNYFCPLSKEEKELASREKWTLNLHCVWIKTCLILR